MGPIYGSLALLLHGNGLDELIMVAAGLAIAFFVITFTSRRKDDEDGDDEEAAVVESDDVQR
jgi:hypothetical protein